MHVPLPALASRVLAGTNTDSLQVPLLLCPAWHATSTLPSCIKTHFLHLPLLLCPAG